MASNGRIISVEGEGNVLHAELELSDGQVVEGVYELLGWTRAPKELKLKMEQELWIKQVQKKSDE
jgi:hypothetical protein